MHGTRPTLLSTRDHRGLQKRLGELLLFILFQYKWVLLVVWIAAIFFWFVTEVLLVELEILEPEPKEPH